MKLEKHIFHVKIMPPFKFTIFLLLSLTATDVESSHEYDYSFEDPRQCPGDQKLLPLLPDRGWDNLNYNASKEKIFVFQYANCQLAKDEEYLVPDGLSVRFPSPLSNDVKLQFNLIDDWKRYVPLVPTRITVNQYLLYYGDVQGTFSSHFQKSKRLLVLNGTVIVRTQFVVPVYNLIVNSEIRKFSAQFHQDLMIISEHIANDDRKLAYYHADLLVQKYGTSVVEEMTVGGLLIVEDVLPRSFINIHDQFAMLKLQKVAKSTFNQRFNADETEVKTHTQTLKEVEKYKKAVIQSEIFVIGGKEPQIGKNLKLSDWKKSVYDNPGIIEKRGEFLTRLILTGALRHIPSPLIDVLSRTVHQAVLNYHRYNLHSGCTDSKAKNFDFAANSDDNSCNTDAATFAFGGLYQTCTEYPSDFAICSKLQHKNPVTKDFSCPENFQTAILRSHVYQKDIVPNAPQKCAKNVSKSFLFEDSEQICIPEASAVNINYTTFWCSSSSTNLLGVSFGGLYSSISINPQTGSKTCPTDYDTVKIGKDIFTCVGRQQTTPNAVKFGGFFSCDHDNPLTANDNNLQSSNRGCPRGYNVQVAFIDNGCIIEYCIRNEDTTQTKFHSLIKPVQLVSSTEKIDKTTLLIIDKLRKYERRSNTDLWLQSQLPQQDHNSSLRSLLEHILSLPSDPPTNNVTFPLTPTSKQNFHPKSTDVSGSPVYDGKAAVSKTVPTLTIIYISLMTTIFPFLALSAPVAII